MQSGNIPLQMNATSLMTSMPREIQHISPAKTVKAFEDATHQVAFN